MRHERAATTVGLLRFARLIEHVQLHRPTDRPFLIGIDGLAGSGKTTFTATLVRELRGGGMRTSVVTLDDGFWLDTPGSSASGTQAPRVPVRMLEDYDWRRLNAEVIEPVRQYSQNSEFRTVAVVIVEGCFTLRHELHAAYDLRILIHMPRGESVNRAIARDGPGSSAYYINYWQAQEDYYLAMHQPLQNADLVIDGGRPADAHGWPVALETTLSRALGD